MTVARPILFSAPMVRALLNGRKTQTRRVIKPQPTVDGGADDSGYGRDWWLEWKDHENGYNPEELAKFCLYGQPGDLLWVRETWALAARATDLAKVYYKAHEGASHTEFSEFVPTELIGQHQPTWPRFKPSIHMPRWASRITLEIVAVRVERLQDISETDSAAEGCYLEPSEVAANDELLKRELLPHIKAISDKKYPLTVRSKFCHLWSQIHGFDEFLDGADSWDANPWVWVLEFKVHKKNVDALLKSRSS